MAQKSVSKVREVLVSFLKSSPPVPIVEATGCVSTSGWSNPVLAPRVYVTPPADGIQDFDFLATPPKGIVLQVITKIYAPAYFMHDTPDWLRGVRVHAASNAIEHRFALPGKPLVEARFGGGEPGEPVSLLADTADEPVLDTVVDEIALERLSGDTCHSFTLAKLSGWPEVKTEFENQCVTIFGKKVCTKLPKVYRRSCELIVEAEICWPSGPDIAAAAEDCGKQALAAGVLSGLLTGNLGTAAAVFEGYLRNCLTAKGIEVASRVRVGLRQRKQCGDWRPV